MASPVPNRLRFKDPKTPYSESFDDLYFSKDVGMEESHYVYLEGSGVLAAIQEKRSHIHVGEIGFGVGLNFLLTLRAFLQENSSEQTLHYISAEKFPIEAEDLFTLYQAYPDLLPYAEMLLKQYPLLTPGMHRLWFGEGRVILDLLIGDAEACFSRFDFKVDFWYWDGFSPSKNPEAFSHELFTEVKKHSSVGAQGTTFTAAGWVRRGLEAQGFTVSKRPGHGKKRECLKAVIATVDTNPDKNPAWFSRENFSILKTKDQIAVVGAGLAGSAIARALAERGYQVTVYDGNGIAERASSNSVGLFNVQLSKKPNPISQFSQASLAYFLREIVSLNIPHRFGILRQDPDALECLYSSAYPLPFYESRPDGVFLPQCGIVNPQKIVRLRLAHPKIKFISEAITRVEKIGDRFQLFNSSKKKIGDADQVVYSIGSDLALCESVLENENVKNFPLRAIRGQTETLKPNPESAALKNTLVEDGYVTPVDSAITGHEFHVLGATYQAKEISSQQIELDCEKLVNEAKQKWEIFRNLQSQDVVSHKVGYRASTPDKLPLIGPVFRTSDVKNQYEHALKGAPLRDLPSLIVSPGEWVLLGLGSRGITYSSLAAEILASLMTGTSLPIEADLFTHLHPVRFTIRNLRKNPGPSFALS
jgi:tRNA 5-methylaminomethyl-2-thiouridine biosynthesis bifunctional protein